MRRRRFFAAIAAAPLMPALVPESQTHLSADRLAFYDLMVRHGSITQREFIDMVREAENLPPLGAWRAG